MILSRIVARRLVEGWKEYHLAKKDIQLEVSREKLEFYERELHEYWRGGYSEN